MQNRRREGDSLPVVLDRAVSTNIQLQVFLYFGAWFDLLFALLQVIAGWAKYRWIRGTVVVAILCTNFLLCFVLEPCRLYLGYAGNLGEKVPELFLFVFLCTGCVAILLTELVLCEMLASLQPANCSIAPELPCILPMEQACWIVQLVLMICELTLGIRTLRRLIHDQSARFFVALDSPEGQSLDDLSRLGTLPSRGHQKASCI
ncbi:tmem17-a [Symbiodinium natans]|uniref:Tmem17-a protein n=1 Tax=Symbiodinium natans TaxID=878477 RepID=A0A812U867_9DINO|nr:tmem17-a [Symbiodinium natans]